MTKIREGYKETEIGVIPEDWVCNRLERISTLIDGDRGKNYPSPNELVDEGILFLSTSNIKDNKFDTSVTKYITNEKFNSLGKGKLEQKDLIITLRGTLGSIMIFESEEYKTAFINAQMMIIRPDNLVDYKYLYQFMISNSIKNQIAINSTGSAQPQLTKKVVSSLCVSIPPLPEQKRIAEILSTTDAHIEKLDKIIEDYQLLKKGMMKKLLTEGIGHTEFKETEIGRIPKEWEVKTLGEIASICYGKNQKEIEDESGIYKILGTGGVMGKTNSYLWNQPSVLIGRKGTINKPMYIDEPFWTVDTLFYTKINYGYSGKWLYYYLNAIDLAKYNEATGVPSLNSNTLSKIQIAVPTYSQQLEIEYVLSSLDSNINLLNDEKQDFIQLKKSLMEKLLTGKIRVV